MKIIITGKGGCGKSTLSALIAKAMEKRGRDVLLIDADESNLGLYRMLGLDLPVSLLDALGGKKGFSRKSKQAGTMLGGPPILFEGNQLPKECIAVSDRLKVLSIGKIHHAGEGCACPMGRLFRMVFSTTSLGRDQLVIADTAAGLEHFGRKLDEMCDLVLCVIDPCYESITMAKRISELAKELNLPVYGVLNKVTEEIESSIMQALEGVEVIGTIYEDRSIFMDNLNGRPLSMALNELTPICEALEAQWDKA
jgi:CO dehydrogenase maturation factor